MASAISHKLIDTFDTFSGMRHIFDKFLEGLEPRDVLNLATASPVMRAYIKSVNFPKLDHCATYARGFHTRNDIQLYGPVDCFTTAALRFTASEEDKIFGEMLQILSNQDIYPKWHTLAVVIAANLQEALRAQTCIKQAGMFAYVSHGFPCRSTRERIHSTTGLCVLILYRLGGELFHRPYLMITLHPPRDLESYIQHLAIGAKRMHTICTLEMRDCLAVCQIWNHMETFNCPSEKNPSEAIVPAGK